MYHFFIIAIFLGLFIKPILRISFAVLGGVAYSIGFSFRLALIAIAVFGVGLFEHAARVALGG